MTALTLPRLASRRLPRVPARLRSGLRWAVPLALIAVTARHLDWGVIANRLSGADAGLLVLAIGCLTGGQLLCGARWGLLARESGSARPVPWFVRTYMKGCFYSSVLPTGYGGDVVRVMALRQEIGARKASTSVVADRVTGLLAVLVVAALVLPWSGYTLGGSAGRLVGVAGAIALGAALVVGVRRGLSAWLIVSCAYVVVWSLGIWLVAAAVGVSLPAAAVPAITVVVAVLMALPISVGGTGTREAGFVLALAPLGVGADAAVAVGIAYGLALLAPAAVGAPVVVLERPAGARRLRLPKVAWWPRSTGVQLGIVLTGALVLRVLTSRRGLWLDETISVYQADRSVGEVIRRQIDGFHPPSFHLELHWLMDWLGTSPLALRALPIAWSLVTVVAVWAWAREAFGGTNPWPATLLAAFSPFAVWYGTEVRMYAQLLALTAVAGWLAWRLLGGRPRARLTAVGLGAALAGIVYTHYFGALFLAALGSVAVVLTVARGVPVRRGLVVIGALGAASALFVPWAAIVLTQRDAAAAGEAPVYPQPDLFSVMGAGWEMLIGFQAPAVGAALVACWPATCLVLFLLLPRLHRVNWRASGLLMLAVVPPLLLVVASVVSGKAAFDPRYLTVSVAPLYLLVGRMIAELPPRAWRVAGAALIAGAVAASVAQTREPWNNKLYEIDKALATVQREARPGDALMLMPAFQRAPVLHYYRPRPGLEIVSPTSPDAALAAAGPGRRVFLVTTFEDDALNESNPREYRDRLAAAAHLLAKHEYVNATVRLYRTFGHRPAERTN